jgi:tRNA nucleotidyltransferase (CCA-adding enzyme)
MGKTPKDWDVTTNAKPEEIMGLFEKTLYENDFGTVAVFIPVTSTDAKALVDRLETEGNVSPTDVTRETYNTVEVTTYRLEPTYSDFRHPDEVKFSNNLKDDLKRRDFTINAMAYSISKGQIVDFYNGQGDIKDKVIRAVGDPQERFTEDALRMLRAIRFASSLGFAVDYSTMQAIITNAHLLKHISSERIHDEFIKIIESSNPSTGIGLLSKLGMLQYIIPELEEGIDCVQGGSHIYDVFEHCLQALNHAAEKEFSTHVRLAALFHDIGKPRTRRPGQKKAYTFYGHEVVGAKMTKKILERLKFPKTTTDLVVSLVRHHMFFSDTEQISLSAVRRIVQKVGPEHIWELMEVRECDRVGMKKKEAPYRLRKYHAMIEEVLRDPISVSQLKIDGEVMIRDLGIKPGPRMGWILHALLEEVLENPEKNTLEYLKKSVLELDTLSDQDLRELGEKGKQTREDLEEEEIEKLHAKHGVK